MVPTREHLPYVLGTIGVMVTCAAIGAAFMPALLAYSPLTLIALSPLGRHLLVAATMTPMVPFVAVGALRRLLACVLAYYLGHIYGEEGIAWVETRYPRAGRLARWLERAFRRVGPILVLISPTLSFSALAGVIRMRFWLFVPMALTGQAIWMTGTYLLGDALKEWIEPITAFLMEYMGEATAVSIVLVAGYEFYRRRNRRGGALAELTAATEEAE